LPPPATVTATEKEEKEMSSSSELLRKFWELERKGDGCPCRRRTCSGGEDP
jgi:hypothetical protein